MNLLLFKCNSIYYGKLWSLLINLELYFINVITCKLKIHFVGGKREDVKKCFSLCFLVLNADIMSPNQFSFLFRIVKAEKYNIEFSFVQR